MIGVMLASFKNSLASAKGIVILPCLEGNPCSKILAQFHKDTLSRIDTKIAASKTFRVKGGIIDVGPSQNSSFDSILLLGLGKSQALSPLVIERLATSIFDHLHESTTRELNIALDNWQHSVISAGMCAAHIAQGISLHQYHYRRFKTKAAIKIDLEPPKQIKKICFAVDSPKKAREIWNVTRRRVEAISICRDNVTHPPNYLNPESFAKQATALKKLGAKVTILNEAQMQKLGFGAFLAVCAGSRNGGRLAIIEWNGIPDSKTCDLAVVGKGITFDSGGLSIKPGSGMGMMKFDMAGAAAVFSLMRLLVSRKAEANVVGVLALAENMPDGNAFRPSDVLTSYSGQTIEVTSTDAEGRLVLADAISYIVEKYKPEILIDLATLTGGVIAALNLERAGLLSNSDELSAELLDCGEKEGERLWRLPMGEEYEALIQSDIADMKDLGGVNFFGITCADASIGAHFIGRFIGNTKKWAHLDIAGTAWAFKSRATVPEGASGYGVRLLDRYVREFVEG